MLLKVISLSSFFFNWSIYAFLKLTEEKSKNVSTNISVTGKEIVIICIHLLMDIKIAIFHLKARFETSAQDD
jgi:hypothetical protein